MIALEVRRRQLRGLFVSTDFVSPPATAVEAVEAVEAVAVDFIFDSDIFVCPPATAVEAVTADFILVSDICVCPTVCPTAEDSIFFSTICVCPTDSVFDSSLELAS